jgi:hypothetical protein
MTWRLEEEFKDLNDQWLLTLDHHQSSQPIMRKQSTSFKNKKLGHAK